MGKGRLGDQGDILKDKTKWQWKHIVTVGGGDGER